MTTADGSGDFKDEVLRQFAMVRRDIERLSTQFDGHKDRVNAEVSSLKVEVATLKMKLSFMAGFYGVLGGAIAAFITILSTVISGHFGKP
ncbi:MAG: hypothetical protein ABSA78_08685 [Candidatus Sulfotelmatobacter sp.]